jgi:hypothetical protein
MDINRNQYFLMGLVLLLLGFQFRMIDTVTLTPKCASFLAGRASGLSIAGSSGGGGSAEKLESPASRIVKPPEWLGWALVSMGSVLVLHSLAMKRPE